MAKKLRSDYFRRRNLSRTRHSDYLLNFLTTQAARLGLTAAQTFDALKARTSMAELKSRRGWIPITNKAHLPNASLSSGSNQAATYRVRYTTKRAVTQIKLVYSNFRLTSSNEAFDTAVVTYRATVETGVGTNTVAVTFGGGTSVTLNPGESATSDPITISFADETPFYVRTRVSVPVLGQKWATGAPMLVSGATQEGFVATDFLTGAVPSLSGAGTIGPSAILGLVNEVAPSIGIIGSSSAAGQGDTRLSDTGYWDAGYLSKIITASGYGHSVLAASGDSLLEFLSNTTMGSPAYGRLKHLRDIDANTVIMQLGGNDITGAEVTAAQIIERLKASYRLLKGLGYNVIATTITPTTTSSDSWATTANQTLHVRNQVRLDVNTWIRTVPADVSAVIDAAIHVQDPTEPGKWRVNGGAWTGDGTHLTLLGHEGVKSAIGTLTL